MAMVFPSLNERPGTRRWLLIILGVALVLHLLSSFAVYSFRPESISTTPDPLDYRLAALNLIEYHQFSFASPEYDAPQLLRTPVYPFFLAGTYLLDGKTGLVMILLQSFMLVVMGWLLFRLLNAFRVSDKIALVLVTIYLVEPLQWLYTLHTMTETFASFLILVLITSALVGKGINDWSRAALYGVGLGLTVLVKPSAMMWLPFLLLLVLCAPGDWRSRVVRIAIAGLFLVFTLTPWMIRNFELTGHPVVSSSGTYAIIEFASTPETLPSTFWNVVKIAEYNGHTNQVWYAYTANAYPMLVAGKKDVIAHLDYSSFITKQLACAPSVWFGFIKLENQRSYGHEYSLIANFVAGANASRDAFLNKVDTTIWALALLLTLLGIFLMLRDSRSAWRFLPLLGMLLAAIFINFCAAWARVLIPLYPVVLVAIGVSVTFLTRKILDSRP